MKNKNFILAAVASATFLDTLIYEIITNTAFSLGHLADPLIGGGWLELYPLNWLIIIQHSNPYRDIST
ncbi:hypothetical protein [Desulforamulus aquiferis]|uniref:Uncharacterized protein n=1 Tax=Desulforamulus aquiferis TaxID=1397668 RepID=A0AAW7Z9T4_9FIRM|nr:hypothetical protein [Desulforamulus aquiferis]MDO7785841.1 hypothetical protein [Desulforamulus aquiferis]